VSDEETMAKMRAFFQEMERERKDAQGLIRLDPDEMKVFLTLLRGDGAVPGALPRLLNLERNSAAQAELVNGNGEKVGILPRVSRNEDKIRAHDEILHGPKMKPEEGVIHRVTAHAKTLAFWVKVSWTVLAGLLVAASKSLYDWLTTRGG
jgi:hypothetical protein